MVLLCSQERIIISWIPYSSGGLIPPQSYQYRNYEDRDIYSSSLSNTIVNYKSSRGEPLVVQVPCEWYDAYKASFGESMLLNV